MKHISNSELIKLTYFFNDRPAININAFAVQAGFKDGQVIRGVLKGRRVMTLAYFNQIYQTLKMYGYDSI